MKLLTKAIIAKLPKLYATDKVPVEDKVCIVKFFCPWNQWTWYAVEGDVSADGRDCRFFGRVDGHESEWGYWMLSDFDGIRGPGGLRIERDIHFNNRPLPKEPQW